MYQILMIDDEQIVLNSRAELLRMYGCKVDTARTAAAAMNYLAHNEYDCILLDVMLEETNGFTLCKKIRNATLCPIIFLSNMYEDEYQKQGFLSGAEEYIPKTMDWELFWLRIESRIKNYRREFEPTILSYPPMVINLDSRTVAINNIDIQLSGFEFDILALMASRPDYVFSLSEIYQTVWKQRDLNQVQTVQVHISHMRRKLEATCPDHFFLQTVWGKGYKFTPTAADK